jgi:hypothetical protein
VTAGRQVIVGTGNIAGAHLRASRMKAPIEAEPRFGMCGYLSAFPAERQEMS